jgi:hypothetical protein
MRPPGLAKTCVIVMGLSFLAGSGARADLTFNLAADWSDTANPKGPWSYNIAPGVPLTNHLADYDPNRVVFASTQPAYAPGPVTAFASNNPGHIASFLKSVATTKDSRDDFPIGHVYMHGDDPFNSPTSYENSIAGITWTSTTAGTATISGGLWEVSKYLGRTENWRLSLNGHVLTSGVLRPTDPYGSADPFEFSLGTGGAGALVVSLAPHDVLNLEVFRSGNEPATLVGVDWSIDVAVASSTPEPSSLITAGIGISLILAARGCGRADIRWRTARRAG